MVKNRYAVDFYWDPICPWCWITSRWMADVGRQKDIQINWKFFSLKIINRDRKVPEDYRLLHAMGLKALRIAAAVGKDYGNAGVAKIYTALGTRYHHDQRDIDDPSVLEESLLACAFPAKLAQAAEDKSWDKSIEADMARAVAKAGTDVGVPLIVLDGGRGPGFFGPVMSPAPIGRAAVKFWDAIVAACRTPGFFELKRTRETGPLFGKRPEI
jgi:predicted DsbA family dithiol-disulfide isomerase